MARLRTSRFCIYAGGESTKVLNMTIVIWYTREVTAEDRAMLTGNPSAVVIQRHGRRRSRGDVAWLLSG